MKNGVFSRKRCITKGAWHVYRGINRERILDKYVEGWTIYAGFGCTNELFWKTFGFSKNVILSVNQ